MNKFDTINNKILIIQWVQYSTICKQLIIKIISQTAIIREVQPTIKEPPPTGINFERFACF